MGEGYVWVADTDARPQDAEALAGRVVHWLEEQGVVAGEVTHCLLGDELGRAPGPRYAHALGADDGAFALMGGANGVSVDIERRVYVCVDIWTARCPHCAARTEESAADGHGRWTDEWLPLLDALYAWFGGSGPDHASCVRCGRQAGFIDWNFSPPVAVAQLGLTFWNWPMLSAAFLAELSAVLDGHRLVAARTRG
ncbi:hypothetical protein [Streptomyces lunaelactis]|uniref:hypothetical protein n=1 Tax=Streptomyces lunaelactis TaxID=1535768 RepID=UPI0015856C4E|nr:hypothetical protein [Streptomyces lunaelactis]NUL13088.1 hypothetical protein [Streptomyces lunaelactis]